MSEKRPAKPGPSARGPRKDGRELKETILACAQETFAAEGFQPATIKAIATRAGVDTKLVHYYFGSKEDLFTACLEQAVKSVDLFADMKRHLDTGESIGVNYVRTVLTHMEDSAVGPMFLGVLRSLGNHEPSRQAARRFLQEVVFKQLLPPHPAAKDLTRISLVGTQMIGLLLARYILEAPTIAALSIEDLAQKIGPVIDHHLKTN